MITLMYVRKTTIPHDKSQRGGKEEREVSRGRKDGRRGGRKEGRGGKEVMQ